jgi:hypothetical protein
MRVYGTWDSSWTGGCTVKPILGGIIATSALAVRPDGLCKMISIPDHTNLTTNHQSMPDVVTFVGKARIFDENMSDMMKFN